MKNAGQATLTKDPFPQLLQQLEECLNHENLVSGFKTCGIYPLNAHALLKKLPSQSLPKDINSSVSDAGLEQLRSMRSPDTTKTPKRKKNNVEPGKSVSAEEFQDDAAGNESSSDESDKSDVRSSSESSSGDGDKEMETETTSTIPTELKELTYCDVTVGKGIK